MGRIVEVVPYRSGLLDSFFDRFESLFEDLTMPSLLEERDVWEPAFDIIENEKEYVVTAELPGVDPEDIDITISGGILTIRGEKRREEEERGEGYYFLERRYGSFQRSFRLPEDIKEDEIEATYKNGVLKLVIPKAHPGNIRRIEIRKC